MQTLQATRLEHRVDELHLPILRGVELEGIVLQILVGCIGVEETDGRWHPLTPGTAASEDACLQISCDSSRSQT